MLKHHKGLDLVDARTETITMLPLDHILKTIDSLGNGALVEILEDGGAGVGVGVGVDADEDDVKVLGTTEAWIIKRYH